MLQIQNAVTQGRIVQANQLEQKQRMSYVDIEADLVMHLGSKHVVQLFCSALGTALARAGSILHLKQTSMSCPRNGKVNDQVLVAL